MSAQEQWPGTADEYRSLLSKAAAKEEAGDSIAAAGYTVAAMIAGLSQVLDKIAYSARKGR